MKISCGSILVASVLLAFSTFAYATNELEFEAELSGAQEVPNGVETRTTGTLDIDFDLDFTKAEFKLNVRHGKAVTQAHLHCGRAGANGSVVAFLFGFVDGGVDVNGRLSRGKLTNEDIVDIIGCAGGADVNNIASLAFAMLEGRIYVNVHTVANPSGEVRGQPVPERLLDN